MIKGRLADKKQLKNGYKLCLLKSIVKEYSLENFFFFFFFAIDVHGIGPI